MKRLILTALITSIASLGFSQSLGLTDEELAQQILDDLARMNEEAEAENQVGSVVPRKYVQFRFLDRLYAEAKLLEIPVGGSHKEQVITISAQSCFVPSGSANSDAIAFLDVHDERDPEDDFDGYMIASSPALNAMEHPRYDVWVVSCSNEEKLVEASEENEASEEFTSEDSQS